MLSSREKKGVRESLDLLGRVSPRTRVPFSLLIAWLPLSRKKQLVPLVSEKLAAKVTDSVGDVSSALTGKRLAVHLQAMRLELMPKSKLDPIKATRCPLTDLNDKCKLESKGKNTGVACKPREPKSGRGCDDLAGRVYNAKTDGSDVWFAERLFETAQRLPLATDRRIYFLNRKPESVRAAGAKNPRLNGSTLNSVTEFVLYHEFAHIMHLDPTTASSFQELERMYWQAGQLLSLRQREERVDLSHTDLLEFVASTFGYENATTRKR